MDGHLSQPNEDGLLALEGLLLMGDLDGAARSSQQWLVNHAVGGRPLPGPDLQRVLAVAAQTHWLTGR